MIRAVSRPNEALTFEASVGGIAIYLDNFAIKSLAKDDPSLRKRFVAAVNGGADLLFSCANAAEISGPQGASSLAIREFLDELGGHWYPVEMLLDTVMTREAAGEAPGKCCFAGDLLQAYFTTQTSQYSPHSGKVIDLSERFFRLGAFVDWLAPQRKWFLDRTREFDADVKSKIDLLRTKARRNPGWIDAAFPQPQFNPSKAATFVYDCLVRNLILDRGYQVRDGDGIDFHHAVLASAFANFAALDKQWKRRVESLPGPNTLARVYYQRELMSMISDIESAIIQLTISAPTGDVR